MSEFATQQSQLLHSNSSGLLFDFDQVHIYPWLQMIELWQTAAPEYGSETAKTSSVLLAISSSLSQCLMYLASVERNLWRCYRKEVTEKRWWNGSSPMLNDLHVWPSAPCLLSAASADTPFSLPCCAVCCLIEGEVSVWVCSPWKWLLFALCKLLHFVMNMPFSRLSSCYNCLSAFWCSNIHMYLFCRSVTGKQ